ncbi:MAG: hypothetical protein IJP74_01160 [Prevotella sp.]|nr:hypothetical protein [Prevotella sp.]MBR0047914.1 hypothetical protein [Prevotella sp.]
MGSGIPSTAGDLNGDKVTDVGDVIEIFNFMAAPSEDAGDFDLNDDGSVDVGDIMMLINKIAGY